MTDLQKSSLLEMGRVLLLALVGYLLIEGVVALLIDYLWGIKLDVTQKTVVIGLVLSVLKSVDKFLHEKEMDKSKSVRTEGWLGVRGLTNF